MLGTELIEIPRQTEVGQEYVPVYTNEDVLRLEICMDDSMSVKLVEGNQDLCHENANGIEGYTTFQGPTLFDSASNIGDVQAGDDVKGGCVIESGDER